MFKNMKLPNSRFSMALNIFQLIIFVIFIGGLLFPSGSVRDMILRIVGVMIIIMIPLRIFNMVRSIKQVTEEDKQDEES